MVLHELKLNQKFDWDVFHGDKLFELRKNDRDYKQYDKIHFTAVDDDGVAQDSQINYAFYEISYVLKDYPGLEEGYCILGLRRYFPDV